MMQTLAAIRTRPTTFVVADTGPDLGVVRLALLMWKLQARRVRTLS